MFKMRYNIGRNEQPRLIVASGLGKRDDLAGRVDPMESGVGEWRISLGGCHQELRIQDVRFEPTR
jgi:hypothetical protein